MFEEFLVIVEHVEAAFEVRKTHGHGLELLLVVQVAQVFLAQHVVGHVVLHVGFGFKVERFELFVGDFFKIAYA